MTDADSTIKNNYNITKLEISNFHNVLLNKDQVSVLYHAYYYFN